MEVGNYATYEWSTGSLDKEIEVHQGGLYTIDGFGCERLHGDRPAPPRNIGDAGRGQDRATPLRQGREKTGNWA